jgi:streptomycin 6-kinase
MEQDLISTLPRKFVENTISLCGEVGREWLESLPSVIAQLEKDWDIIVGRHFLNLSYNYVANAALLNGKAAVLKIALPLNKPEIGSEAAYLKTLDGKGVVRALNFDDSRKALLMERVSPGANLKSFCKKDPDSAVQIAIDALSKVLRPVESDSGSFAKLDNWFAGLERAIGTGFPQEYAEKALQLYKELRTSDDRLFLTHGDLHHENIISSYRERFLLIDPKGLIGHFGYDIGVFLNNHHWWLDDDTRVPARLDRAVKDFAGAFHMEEAIVRKWAFCQMVLSWWWTFDGEGAAAEELGLSEIWNI